MRIRPVVLIGVSVVVLAATSSLALHYRSRAIHYQRAYGAAMARLDRLASEQVVPSPVAPRVEIARQAPAPPRPAGVEIRPLPARPPESQVAEKDATAASASVALPPRPPEPDRMRRRPADWMENLRTNDPQRYADFQQRRQEMQQNMQNAWVQTTNYFMNRDTSKMTQPEFDEYSTMVTLLDQTWALNQQLQAGLPADARRQVMTDLRSNVVALAPLLDNERNREYYDMSVAMGQGEDAAATMVSYINQITSNTSLRVILPGVRMGRMPGGPPPFLGNPPPFGPPAR